jgi:hypothetical protein
MYRTLVFLKKVCLSIRKYVLSRIIPHHKLRTRAAPNVEEWVLLGFFFVLILLSSDSHRTVDECHIEYGSLRNYREDNDRAVLVITVLLW